LRLARGDRPGGVDAGGGGPVPPPELGGDALAVWDEVIEAMPADVLKVVDSGALALYCQSYIRWRECEKHIEEHGAVVVLRNDRGEVRAIQSSPYVVIGHKYRDAMLKAAAECGLTPTSRARLRMPEKKPATKLMEMVLKRGGAA
jgi:P27 family predicted phage terminase small subunit